MRTYQELFRATGFRPLFAASVAQVAAGTVGGLALGTLVYAVTGSPLLSSLAMFGTSLAQVLGALFLLSAADTLPARSALVLTSVTFAVGTAVLTVPGLPIWSLFAVLAILGPVSSVSGGVRYGLLSEVLPAEGYVLGRSVLNMAAGLTQVTGYALGAVLVAVLSPRGALLLSAGLHLVAAAVSRWGLEWRPARRVGRPSAAATWRTNVVLWSSAHRRYVYLALWVPNGLVVGCESLFVPYAPHRAGLLFAFAALGMLTGDTLVGRFVPARWRAGLEPSLRLLLALPYAVFAVRPPLAVAVVAVTVASVGYAASLLLQERLVALTPEDVRGHAFGLHSSGMLTAQGVGAALAGAVAQWTSPATGVAVVAAASVAVTVLLAPGLRAARRAVHGECGRRASAAPVG